jgi:microcystin-dependent protein
MTVRLQGSTSGYTEIDAPAVAGNNTLVLPSAGTTIAALIPGEVKWFAMNSAPSGFLKANGAAVSRTTYANLFAAIGTLYGAGNGTTTFNVPDLRGEFVRGFDDGRGVDAGRVIGSAQADELKSHFHTYNSDSAVGNFVTGGPSPLNDGSQTLNTGPSGGTETRPRNIALLACIAF